MKKVSCIFIVDDDPITVFGIRKMLKSVASCDDVQIFQNGKEAFDALLERHKSNINIPNVIFLDINMPIMDGWDFLDELITLDLKKHIIINMITSSIDPLDHQKWSSFKDRCPYILKFKNKPIFKIEATDLGLMDMAS